MCTMYSLGYNVHCHTYLIFASGGTEVVCVSHGERRGRSSLDDNDGGSRMTGDMTAEVGAENMTF